MGLYHVGRRSAPHTACPEPGAGPAVPQQHLGDFRPARAVWAQPPEEKPETEICNNLPQALSSGDEGPAVPCCPLVARGSMSRTLPRPENLC